MENDVRIRAEDLGEPCTVHILAQEGQILQMLKARSSDINMGVLFNYHEKLSSSIKHKAVVPVLPKL